MFLFKKLVSPLLFPMPIVLLLLLIGLVLMWTGSRRSKNRGSDAQKIRGFGWMAAATVLLMVFSFRPIPLWMLSDLEYRYPPVETVSDSTIRWVVVLAGGVSDDPRLDGIHQLSSTSVVRLAEGVRLVRQLPSARLVLSGGGPFSKITAASVMRELALAFGVADSTILIEDTSLDTKDQAIAVGEIVGREPFFLVTSAMHMPRSMALFAARGTAPIAAPTGHLARSPKTLHPGAFYPSSLNMRAARLAWREHLGMWWAKIRGQA